MATFYDKLGDLLNETLEAGEIRFVKVERPDPPKAEASSPEASGAQDAALSEAEQKAEEIIARIKAERTERLQAQRQEYRPRAHGTIYHGKSSPDARSYTPGQRFTYKKLTPPVEQAYRLLGIPAGAPAEDIKRAYKERLMQYHPDHYAGDAAQEQAASEKTRQIVTAYRLLLDFVNA